MGYIMTFTWSCNAQTVQVVRFPLAMGYLHAPIIIIIDNSAAEGLSQAPSRGGAALVQFTIRSLEAAGATVARVGATAVTIGFGTIASSALRFASMRMWE